MKQFTPLALAALLAACGGAQPAADEEPTEQPTTQPSTGHHHDHGHDDAHHAEHAVDTEHHGQGMHHRFDDPERWSKVFDNPERDAWQKPDEVVSLMKIEPGMTVADIGAGTGYFLGRLAKAVGPEGRVLGLDIEEKLVAHMNARAKEAGWTTVEARVVSPSDPGLPAKSVDRILIVDTWHHISDRPQYAAKLAAALKPGGELHIVDFEPDSERGPSREHKLAKDAVVNELTEGGLTVEIIEETLPDQYIVVGRPK